MAKLTLVASLLLALGCRPEATKCPEAGAATVRELDRDAAVESSKLAADRRLGREAGRVADPDAPTAGMVPVEVTSVLEADAGQWAVILLEPSTPLVLPIFIGQQEAMAIMLRLQGQHFPRPLTHDLLEKVMLSADLAVVRVEIDAIEDATFLAHLYLRDDSGDMLRLDARPSDGVALAVGAHAPVFVAPAVLESAGRSPGELGIDPSSGAPTPRSM